MIHGSCEFYAIILRWFCVFILIIWLKLFRIIFLQCISALKKLHCGQHIGMKQAEVVSDPSLLRIVQDR
jgi:hypothetical protein